MWLASVVMLIGLSAQPVVVPTAPDGLSFVAEPITTRQTVFSIPFQLERPANPAAQPVEVQLYVSNDQGRNWALYSKVRPDQKNFLFRAGGDGEFWFIVRTVDQSGSVRPDPNRAPILRVFVDTQPPNLQLRATRGRDGQITAQWQIQDANIKLDTLLLQYRVSASQPWQAIAVSRQSTQFAGPVQTGEVTWWPGAKSGVIQVRAEVLDAAGNPAVSHAQVSLDEPAPVVPPAEGGPATVSAVSNSTLRPAEGNPSVAGSADANPPGLADSVKALLVRSLRFDLDYDAAAAALLGPSRAELWCTQDGGANWSLWLVNDTNRSPLRVQVPKPGAYGFRLAFRNAAGQGDPPPQRGDRPELLLDVDPRLPAGRIRDVRPVPNGQ